MKKRNTWTESYEAPRASNIELVNDGILLAGSFNSENNSTQDMTNTKFDDGDMPDGFYIP